MTVTKVLDAGRTAKLVGADATDARGTVLPCDLAFAGHDHDSMIPLVSDQHFFVGQHHRRNGIVQLVGASAGDALLAVLPGDLAFATDLNDAIVWTTVGTIGGNTRRQTATDDQRRILHALGVARPDDRIRYRMLCHALFVFPNNGLRVRVQFDDPVVVLVNDEQVALLVEPWVTARLRPRRPRHKTADQ